MHGDAPHPAQRGFHQRKSLASPVKCEAQPAMCAETDGAAGETPTRLMIRPAPPSDPCAAGAASSPPFSTVNSAHRRRAADIFRTAGASRGECERGGGAKGKVSKVTDDFTGTLPNVCDKLSAKK